jgi:MFS family permease
MQTNEHAADRFGAAGAALTAVGIVLSGPIGLVVVTLTHPVAPWTSAEVYARQFHWVQTLPFYAGFVLLAGCVMVMAALFAVSNDAQRPRAGTALVATAAFMALIAFNYVCQTTFVPTLLRAYEPSFAPVISTLSLQNPTSLAWAIEMWGYGLFGVATWLMAPVLDRTPIERAAGRLMIANGVMSLAGGLVTTIKLDWVMTTTGMVNYGLWNVLMLALAALLVATFRARMASPSHHRHFALRNARRGDRCRRGE